MASGDITISALVPEKVATTTVNCASGGDVKFTNTDNTKNTFSFPANFCSKDVTFKMFSYASDTLSAVKPAPSGQYFTGKTYDFNLFASSSNAQMVTTSLPITITLSYSDADVSGLDESTIAPYRWGTGDSSWQLISGATVNTANNTVTFETTHFSSFALFAATLTPPPTPAPSPSPSGGGSNSGGYSPSSQTMTAQVAPLPGDFTSDGRVNIVDFSIMAYWYGRPNSPSSVDLDHDGKIDLTDFSILAYYWTG